MLLHAACCVVAWLSIEVSPRVHAMFVHKQLNAVQCLCSVGWLLQITTEAFAGSVVSVRHEDHSPPGW